MSPATMTPANMEDIASENGMPRTKSRDQALKLQALTSYPFAMAKALKAMKAMAAMKAMKAMKKKAVSKIAKGRYAKSVVFRGTKAKTYTGLTKADLVKNKRGKIVTKKQQALGKALFAKHAKAWVSAVQKARKALGLKGFVAIKKGTPLYTKAKEL